MSITICHNFLKEYSLGNHRLTNVEPRIKQGNKVIFLIEGYGLGLMQGDYIAFNYQNTNSIDERDNHTFLIGKIKRITYKQAAGQRDHFCTIVESKNLTEWLLAELNYTRIPMVRLYREIGSNPGQILAGDSRDFGFIIFTDLLEKAKFREMIERQLAYHGGK
ncbi:MAG: hypothetical protein WC449_02465 [Candidatus Paceibacterota bacterium]